MHLGTSTMLPTQHIPEWGNLYFTDARATAAAVSAIKTINASGAEVTLVYSSATVTVQPITTGSIALSKLAPTSYSTTAIPSTLVCRDAQKGIAVDRISGAVDIVGSLTVNGAPLAQAPTGQILTVTNTYSWTSSSTINPLGWQPAYKLGGPSGIGITLKKISSYVRLTASVWAQASPVRLG